MYGLVSSWTCGVIISGMAQAKPEGQRRRRNSTPGFIQIDPSPRTEPAPEWPLDRSALAPYDDREQARWAELWQLPQAREWERMRCFTNVALYVRLEVIVTIDTTNNPKLLTELRQLDMSLGISPKAMIGLRWEIAQPPADDATRPAATLHSVDRRAYVPAAAGA